MLEKFEEHLRSVIHSCLLKPPEEMLGECLDMLIKMSGAVGGSIIGEEGNSLKFLFSDFAALIGARVPWDSIAGESTRRGMIIYTYAPQDKRHFSGVDKTVRRSTKYLLSIPIPAVTRANDNLKERQNAGVLQLLFDEDVFPELKVQDGAREFSIDTLREHEFYVKSLQYVCWILPNISFGVEVMRLRETSYQAIHELKNKMIAAQSWLNYLKEDLADEYPDSLASESLAEDFSLAHDAVAEGAELAKSYLQFTKIYTPKFADADINHIIRDTAASLRVFAENIKAPVLVSMNLDNDIPVRKVDAAQLKMALFNLGKNAVEALHEQAMPNPEIRLESALEDTRLILKVTDNGNGMPAEIAENLFVAFKTKKVGGTGLGLTICKKIIDVHGGIINCRTGAEGTQFTIYL